MTGTSQLSRAQIEQQLAAEIGVVALLENSAARLQHVQGWLHRGEGFALMRLVAASNAGVVGGGAVVEVGSFKGLSTCWLAMGVEMLVKSGVASGQAGPVYAVDHFAGSPEHQPGGTHPDPDVARDGTTLNAFEANLARAGLAAFVQPMVQPSLAGAAAWDKGPIRLCFIDGDHSYEASRQDWNAWAKHVPQGGYLCLHDVGSWPGVTQLAEELAKDLSCGFVRVMGVATLQVFRRA